MTAAFDQAETILRLHRLRDGIFDLPFADPPWEILLTLFVAQREAQGAAVKDVAASSALPPTTAARWITLLADRGLVERTGDICAESAGRVRLTPAALDHMERLLG